MRKPVCFDLAFVTSLSLAKFVRACCLSSLSVEFPAGSAPEAPRHGNSNRVKPTSLVFFYIGSAAMGGIFSRCHACAISVVWTLQFGLAMCVFAALLGGEGVLFIHRESKKIGDLILNIVGQSTVAIVVNTALLWGEIVAASAAGIFQNVLSSYLYLSVHMPSAYDGPIKACAAWASAWFACAICMVIPYTAYNWFTAPLCAWYGKDRVEFAAGARANSKYVQDLEKIRPGDVIIVDNCDSVPIKILLFQFFINLSISRQSATP